MTHDKLLAVIQSASPLGQRILQILACCEAEVSTNVLLPILIQCQWAAAPSKNGVLNKTLLKAELKQLYQRSLIGREDSTFERVLIFSRVQDPLAQYAVVSDNFPIIAKTLEMFAKELCHDMGAGYGRRADQPFREARFWARLAFYAGDVDRYRTAVQALEKATPELADLGLLEPFNKEIFARLPAELQAVVLTKAVSKAILTECVSPQLIAVCRDYVSIHDDLLPEMGQSWVTLLLASGDVQTLKRLADQKKTSSPLASGCADLLTGQLESAEAVFEQWFALPSQATGTRNEVVPQATLPGLLYLLLVLRKPDPKSRARLRALCNVCAKNWPRPYDLIPAMIPTALSHVDAPTAQTRLTLTNHLLYSSAGAPLLIKILTAHLANWFLPDTTIAWEKSDYTTLPLAEGSAVYQAMGMQWMAAICEDAAGSVSKKSGGADTTIASERHLQLGTTAMLQWIEPLSPWKKKLEALQQVVVGKPATAPGSPADLGFDERMIWEVDVDSRGCATVRPIIQKLSKGQWSKGRPVALSRLYGDYTKSAFAFLSDQDRAVCKTIEESEASTGYYNYTETVYHFDLPRTLLALIGHPLIFSSGNRTQPLDVSAQKPQLLVQRTRAGLRLELQPKPRGDNSIAIHKDGAQRIVLVEFSPLHLRLAGILDGTLDVPRNGEADVLATVKTLSSVLAVQSDIALEEDSAQDAVNVKKIAADSRPHLHLLPFHAGLRVEFFVQPLGDRGPAFAPGKGGTHVFTDVQGDRVSAHRDLKLETRLAHETIQSSPTLNQVSDGSLAAMEFPLAEDALEMLLQIEPLRHAGQIVVHWPQGQSLNIAGTATVSNLNLRIARNKDWFAATGELVVDELLKMDMLKLMDLVSARPGRFVQLSDGRFLALTEELRRRVGDLCVFGQRQANALRISQIRAAALMDIDQWCTLKSDKHWKACLQRIREAGDVVAEVPSTLNAELRDYQVEGFRWLCRLAHWGAGACLADDMGLGKTLQAIAVLLRRGGDGPALVIAPMSVCFNWEAELRKFAPTLNPRMFGAGDRSALIGDLGPRDVVITSYGLLNTETERLQGVHWYTAILDEAQAIKNTLTKRSQAAMALTADFRMIMTGTPIENHLGELWNLFQFINPGLLGSPEDYHQQFALPIERDHNRDARQQLKHLVQPFLLRRTKTQVLSELPSRTEVMLPVTLSDEEAVLYEAARQRAVNELTKQEGDKKGRHLRVLAELTRLRRACCHPSLLLPDCGLPGAKLTAFSQTVDELIENKHKALVFSQFVDHLAILRKELDRKQVSYQYLDGSTPMTERKRSVEAFQNGEGDVFLISLKAGGTGLNLTAADYVLQMDPWWNPAVEDQAADRAHRMGQLRPVTIYRFITLGTIEEKILELHSSKRDLADSLLEGTDTTGRLSAKELLALIQ